MIIVNTYKFYFVSLSDGDGSVRVRFLQSAIHGISQDPSPASFGDARFEALNFVMDDITIKGKTYKKGQAYLNGNVLSDSVPIFTIAFDGIHCRKLMSDVGLDIDKRGDMINIYDFDGIKKIYDELLEMYPDDADLKTPEIISQITAKNYFYRALHCLENVSQTRLETAKRKLLVNAEEYMRNNFSRGITIEDTSEYLSIDRRYLYKLFKKYSGTSPKQYLSNIKISYSCDLLLNSEMTIGDIAERVGYSDSLQFSAFFKKQTGMSPRKYRNLNQSNS